LTHSLFVPRDFDISPYFQIIKPELTAGFDYRFLRWETSPTDYPDNDDRRNSVFCKNRAGRNDQHPTGD
jgi:hypothetical protein